MSEVLTYEINSFSLKSSWTNKNGNVQTTPSTARSTKTVSVDGLPESYSIVSVTLNVTTGSPLGGARVLKVNDNNLESRQDNAVDFTSFVTGNGDWDFEFVFQSHGQTGLSDGSHYGSMAFNNITLVITYDGSSPSDDPVEPEDLYDYPDSHNICFYPSDEEDFTTNGLGILTPISCVVTEEAGGQYELEMTLPADGDLWTLIQCEYIIKAPVPVVTVEAFEMAGASYWKVKATQANVPVKSRIPSVTRASAGSTYPGWTAGATYNKGAKVSFMNKAWQYTGANGQRTVVPGAGGYWVDITSSLTKVNSGKTLATMVRNEVFTKIADERNNWIRVKTGAGVTGYVDSQYVEYYAEADTHVETREIRQQCFRVYRIDKDSDSRTVTINARHLSYDFAKTYLQKCMAKTVTVPTAISLIEEAELTDDNRQMYTDIAEETVDLDCSWDNGVSALLNPDAGVVAQLQAKLIRDNEDFFILQDTHIDRGYRITYGNNLKALRWTTDTSSMVTRVIPHAKTADDEDLLLPEQWVDSPLIDEYPVVYIEALAVNCKVNAKGTTVDGDEVEHLTEEQCYEIMRAEANKRFDTDHMDEPEVTIDVDMVMLGATVEYQHLANTEILFMYDTVHIRHPLLSLDIEAQMTGYEYDAILRRYQRIRLTNARRRQDSSISGFDLPDNSIRFEKLSSTAVDRLKGG